MVYTDWESRHVSGLDLELLLSAESSAEAFLSSARPSESCNSAIGCPTFYPRFRFFTPRVESAPLPRARAPRPLAPLPRPPLAVFAEGGAEGERKTFSTRNQETKIAANGSKRTWRSSHFDFLVLTIVGTSISTRVNTPLRCRHYNHALVSALHSECATVALRGNVTCRPGGSRCSSPSPSSSPAPRRSSTPFGRWPRWRWGWRG
jgi:hypothetical protein